MRIAVNCRLLVPEKMDGIGRFTYESLKLICLEHPEVQFDFIFDRKINPAFQFSKASVIASGQTTLTLIPNSPHSVAATLDIPLIPSLSIGEGRYLQI